MPVQISQIKKCYKLCLTIGQCAMYSPSCIHISLIPLIEVYCLRFLQVEELVTLSLNQPVRLFVDNNTDVAHNLRQEFVRIRGNRENDRLAIVTGM